MVLEECVCVCGGGGVSEKGCDDNDDDGSNEINDKIVNKNNNYQQ